jgi:hypothetical protein
MRIFSKKTFKNFKNICEAASTDLPKGFETGEGEQVNTQTNYYHGQGGMSMYNVRTHSNTPQWMYTGVPEYITPNGVVIIPPDPRTGLFLPNMLPGVHLINIFDPFGQNGIYLYTFDWESMGGMNAQNAYNLLLLNMIMNPYFINNYGNISYVETAIQNIGNTIERLASKVYPGFYDGDGDLFVRVFFPPEQPIFDTQVFDFINQIKNTLPSGQLDFQYITLPDILQS